MESSDKERFKYWTAELARKKQTSLTTLSNGIIKHVLEDAPTRELFTDDELDALRVATAALANVKKRFEKLKEQRQREELRKENEKKQREQAVMRTAKRVVEGLGVPADSITRQVFLLMLTANEYSKRSEIVDDWELDTDRLVHTVPNDHHATRSLAASRMRDLAERLFSNFLLDAWSYNFGQDSYRQVMPLEEKVSELLALANCSEYEVFEARYAKLLDSLESFNRAERALELRKSIKPV